MTTTEHEDYSNLVKSPGWQRLLAWADADLQAQMTRHIDAVANHTDDQQALALLRQVIAARRMVDVVLQHPATRLKQLAPKDAPPPSLSRGGI